MLPPVHRRNNPRNGLAPQHQHSDRGRRSAPPGCTVGRFQKTDRYKNRVYFKYLSECLLTSSRLLAVSGMLCRSSLPHRQKLYPLLSLCVPPAEWNKCRGRAVQSLWQCPAGTPRFSETSSSVASEMRRRIVLRNYPPVSEVLLHLGRFSEFRRALGKAMIKYVDISSEVQQLW